ncbi:MAG: hypothetical protein AB1724_18035 [Thermodesulfobacteriota bacterium]
MKNKTGDWSWQKAREYYYTFLSGKDFTGNAVADTRDKREAAFADCFRSVGQVMHLLQDMSVPLHTRNDAHILPLFGVGQWTYETYTKENVDTGRLDYTPDKAGDRPDLELIATPYPEPAYSNLPPVTGLIDRNQYNGLRVPAIDENIGLAEYSNANFLTNDTLFKYPHPALDETNYDESIWQNPEQVDAEDGQTDSRIYFKKITGDPVEHLMAAGYWSHAIAESGWDRPELQWSFVIDKTCFADYADKLMPRAVGYSAALLDYFFRGKMDLVVDQDVCRIANQTEEQMEGTFGLYYDTVGGERRPVTDLEKWPWSHTGWVSAGDQSEDLDLFAVPGDAQTPGEYMLVFKGRMGNETSNAVAASKITIPAIRISLPEEGYYAFTDRHPYHDPSDARYMNTPATNGFNKIVVNAENLSPQAGEMSGGAVTLLIRYRQGLTDQFVSPPGETSDEFYTLFAGLPESVSIPSGAATRLEFDLTGREIPLWATDVHLFLLYAGHVGGQSGRICLGYKDISEPTQFDFFNVMDKTCLNGELYDAGSAEAIAVVDTNKDGIAQEWDVYPHGVRNLSVRFVATSPIDYLIPFISAGDFFRMFALTDYDYFDMSVSYYLPPLAGEDPFSHSDISRRVYSHRGLTNQISRKAFPGCPYASCLVRCISFFNSFRGQYAWSAMVLLNTSYPTGAQCDYEGL